MSGRHRAKTPARRGTQGIHRQRKPRPQPYKWLGTGAVAFGVGAALMNGTGIAHADDGSGSSETSSTSRGVNDGVSKERGADTIEKSSIPSNDAVAAADSATTTDVGTPPVQVVGGTPSRAHHTLSLIHI